LLAVVATVALLAVQGGACGGGDETGKDGGAHDGPTGGAEAGAPADAAVSDVAARDGGADAAADGATDARDAQADAGVCKLVGTYKMVEILCGNGDVTSIVKSELGVAEIRVVVTDRGGTCHIETTAMGPTCTEADERDVAAAFDGTVTNLPSKGITRCAPENCRFNPNDRPCMLGDHTELPAGSTIRVVRDDLETTSPVGAGYCKELNQQVITTIRYTHEGS
jgi:hypothetical protein